MKDRNIPSFIQTKILKERNKFNLDTTEESIKADLEKVQDLLTAINFIDDNKHNYQPEIESQRYKKSIENESFLNLNAWQSKFKLEGSYDGKLKEKKIIIKDNISIAGIQMMNGSNIIEGFAPDIDASVVTKIIKHGGVIIGKAHCENLCVSGASFTNPKGPILNPNNCFHTSGGSSSGVAALISNKEADIGIGTDSGGSIRIPSSWTGCYGMKPTFGLVPLSGMMCYDNTLDHIGPISQNVYDNALLLEVIAGSDGRDTKQKLPLSLNLDYTKNITSGIQGIKIGILKEGFGHKTSEKIVDENVKKAILKFESLGAIVQEISIPEHSIAMSLCGGIGTEGFYKASTEDYGWIKGSKGLYSENIHMNIDSLKKNANKLPRTAKFEFILGEYLWKKKYGRIYGKSQNLKRIIKQAFDNVFKDLDLVVMPTMPFRAPKIPKKNCDFETYMLRTSSNDCNNAAFNVTGNPCMTIPVARVDELPIGMLIVSHHFNENLIYRAAFAWENKYNWKACVN